MVPFVTLNRRLLMKKKQKFDLRKSPVDGMIRKWEQRTASSLGMITTEDGERLGDYLVWVVTGVYRNRREVFNA